MKATKQNTAAKTVKATGKGKVTNLKTNKVGQAMKTEKAPKNTTPKNVVAPKVEVTVKELAKELRVLTRITTGLSQRIAKLEAAAKAKPAKVKPAQVKPAKPAKADAKPAKPAKADAKPAKPAKADAKPAKPAKAVKAPK